MMKLVQIEFFVENDIYKSSDNIRRTNNDSDPIYSEINDKVYTLRTSESGSTYALAHKHLRIDHFQNYQLEAKES